MDVLKDYLAYPDDDGIGEQLDMRATQGSGVARG